MSGRKEGQKWTPVTGPMYQFRLDADDKMSAPAASTSSSADAKAKAQAAAMDLSQVMTLLKNSTNGDFKVLLKTTEAVKAFLTEDDSKNKIKIQQLMEKKEFVPFLMNSLKAQSNLSPLQINAAWILKSILKDGKDAHFRKLANTEIVSWLLQLLASPDLAVREQVTDTIGTVAFRKEMREVITTRSFVYSNLVDTMVSFLKDKNPPASSQLEENISTIVTNLLARDFKPVASQNVGGGMKCLLMETNIPPESLIMKMLPLISLLLDLNNEKVINVQLQGICVCLVALDSVGPFIEHGLHLKLVTYLSHKSRDKIIGSAVALGTIAAKGPYDLLEFLKSLKGTEGLKKYWRCLALNVSDIAVAERGIKEFTGAMIGLLHEYNKATVINAMFDSGFAQALGLALENGCVGYCREFVMSLLNIILDSDLTESQRRAFAGMNILPNIMNFLECDSTDGDVDPSEAVGIIAGLVKRNPQRRNEAVALGILARFLAILKMKITDICVHHEVMEALKCLLEVNPKAPLATFKKVPKALRNFFYDFPMCTKANGVWITSIKRELVVVQLTADACKGLMGTAIGCVTELAEFGEEGIDAIFENSRYRNPHDASFEMRCLAKKMMDYLKSDVPEMEEKAAQLYLRILQRGNAEHRKNVLKLGFLKQCKQLLAATSDATRKATLECLLLFQNGDLTTDQKKTLEDLRSVVMQETTKAKPATVELARAVYKMMID